MFISTPLVWFVANKLYRQGRLDSHQRDRLVSKDIHINTILTIAGAVYMAAKLF